GIAGFALGPALATPLLLTLGLNGGWALALPGLAIAAALTVSLPRIHGHRRAAVKDVRRLEAARAPDRVGAFARLTATMLVRATLVPLAVALYVPTSPLVLLGQEYLPSSMGTASGVTLGLAVSVGGVVTPGLGAIADHAGLRPTLLLLAVLPVAMVALALTL